jgi:hypothetical protein
METELVNELFRAMHGRYPKTVVQRDGRLTFNFKGKITKEGSIDAFGVDTVPTGSHYDLILADDVVTIRDRYSKAKRERTCDNLREIMTNILDPGKPFRGVGTPWHKEDAWSVMPEPKKYDVYTTGILSPAQIEDKKANTTSVMFAANYELKHISSDDALFKDPVFEPWDGRLVRRVRAHVDARFKGSHYTAATILGQRVDGRYFVWGKVYDADVRSVWMEIHRAFQRKGVTIVHNETNPDKGYTADLFRRTIDGHSLHVEEYHENMNKTNKIQTFITEFWSKLVFAEDCDNEYISQICDYREGQEPDDAPDSLASILREMAYPTDRETSPGTHGLYSR